MSQYLNMQVDVFWRNEQNHSNRDVAVFMNIHFSFQYPVCWSAGKILENKTLQTPGSLPLAIFFCSILPRELS